MAQSNDSSEFKQHNFLDNPAFNHISLDEENSDVPKQGDLFKMYKQGIIDKNISQAVDYTLDNLESPLDTNVNLNSTSPSKSKIPINPANLIVSQRQKGNSVLSLIKNVRWTYGDIEPDYVMSRTSCALFLSLKYHSTKPGYIYNRMRDLKSLFELRVLLVMENSAPAVRELCNLCIINHFTMLLAWSDEEMARYLESYKMYEHKPPDILASGFQPAGSAAADKDDPSNAIVRFLSSIPSVNKTDARTLIENFQTIEGVMMADFDLLKMCSGIGALKARTIYEHFRKSFVRARNIDEDNEEDL